MDGKRGAEQMTRCRNIDLRTMKGFKEAERLKAHGWVVAEVGFTTVTMRYAPAEAEGRYEGVKTLEHDGADSYVRSLGV